MPRRTLVAGILALAMIMTFAVACRPKTYTDGTYEAVSQANNRGYVWVKVTVAGDKISAVEVTEFDGTATAKTADYPWPQAVQAWQDLPAQSVAKNSWQVDVIAEATTTSNKYMDAVKNALEKAKRTPGVAMTYHNGTFMARSDADARGGWGVVWVTLTNDQITEVTVDSILADGTAKDWPNYPWPQADEARTIIAERFVAAGPAGAGAVDIVAEATGSSEQWKQAVERALAGAKVR